MFAGSLRQQHHAFDFLKEAEIIDFSSCDVCVVGHTLCFRVLRAEWPFSFPRPSKPITETVWHFSFERKEKDFFIKKIQNSI